MSKETDHLDKMNMLDEIRQELMRVAKCQVNAVIETKNGVLANIQTLDGVVNIVRSLDSQDIKLLTIRRSPGGGGTGEWDVLMSTILRSICM